MVISTHGGALIFATPSTEANEEACRKVVISLCGSEDRATAVGEALLRYTTLDEDSLVEKWYGAGDEVARQTLEEAGLVAEGAPTGRADEKEPELTAEEERELASSLEALYRRAERR